MEITQLQRLDDSELKTLINLDERTKVSLQLPVQQEPDKREENRIRLKNLVQSAGEMLDKLGFRRPDVTQMLAPAEELIQGGRFLDMESPGLVIYLADGFSRAYQLPYSPEDVAIVSTHFQIKPLMPLRLLEQFYVLVLSQQHVRLLDASQYSVQRMDLHNMPQSLDEALRWDDPEKQLQWHTGTGQANDGRAAMFHGHGAASKDVLKQNLLRYFQLLDQGLSVVLSGKKAPLLLAGVDYLLPIYREANSYKHLVDEEVIGSQEHRSDVEIQQQAWEKAQSYFEAEREAAVSRYHALAAKDLASADLKTVLLAAYQGRVETLFVATDAQEWGTFDPFSGRIKRSSQQKPEDTDLLNLATIYTVQNDGDVHAGECLDMPDEEALSAILRF